MSENDRMKYYGNDNVIIDTETISSYLNAFDRLFLLDNDEPFSVNVRSSIRVKKNEKKTFYRFIFDVYIIEFIRR